MARARIKLLSGGMDSLLKSGDVQRLVTGRAELVLAAARNSAPVASGAYRASLRVVEETHASRVVARVVSDVDYAMVVEANTGNLVRALDAGRG